METRDVLLIIFAAGWLVVLVITAVRGPVPAELWGTLAVGLGAIMAVFKTNDITGRRRRERLDREKNGRVEETIDGDG